MNDRGGSHWGVNRGLTFRQDEERWPRKGFNSTKAADKVSDKVCPFTLSPPGGGFEAVPKPYRRAKPMFIGVLCVFVSRTGPVPEPYRRTGLPKCFRLHRVAARQGMPKGRLLRKFPPYPVSPPPALEKGHVRVNIVHTPHEQGFLNDRRRGLT